MSFILAYAHYRSYICPIFSIKSSSSFFMHFSMVLDKKSYKNSTCWCRLAGFLPTVSQPSLLSSPSYTKMSSHHHNNSHYYRSNSSDENKINLLVVMALSIIIILPSTFIPSITLLPTLHLRHLMRTRESTNLNDKCGIGIIGKDMAN